MLIPTFLLVGLMLMSEVNARRRKRWGLLIRIDSLLDGPMNVLALVWLLLTVVDMVEGLGRRGEFLVIIIWVLFALHFLVEFFLAPSKKIYLKHSWLTAISLLLPAFRIFRIFRALRGLRFIRATNLVRIMGTINRGMKALSQSMRAKGFGYVMGLTTLVVVAGAAGIMSFEATETQYFDHFGTALWWTSMMVTTMGSDYFPRSAEGRFLALVLAVYGFAVFGYVTATVASFIIERGTQAPAEKAETAQLRQELAELKDLVQRLEKITKD